MRENERRDKLLFCIDLYAHSLFSFGSSKFGLDVYVREERREKTSFLSCAELGDIDVSIENINEKAIGEDDQSDLPAVQQINNDQSAKRRSI